MPRSGQTYPRHFRLVWGLTATNLLLQFCFQQHPAKLEKSCFGNVHAHWTHTSCLCMDKAKYKAHIPRFQQRCQGFWHTLKIEAFKPLPLGNSVWKLVDLFCLIPTSTSVLTWDSYYSISSWKVRFCPLQCPLQTNMFCGVYTQSTCCGKCISDFACHSHECHLIFLT